MFSASYSTRVFMHRKAYHLHEDIEAVMYVQGFGLQFGASFRNSVLTFGWLAWWLITLQRRTVCQTLNMYSDAFCTCCTSDGDMHLTNAQMSQGVRKIEKHLRVQSRETIIDVGTRCW
jgi:hypothetical protein